MRESDQDKIMHLHPLDDTRYQTVDLDHLVMYTVGEVEKLHVDLSFENIVAASYTLFPKKFSLLGFPCYPDSDRVMNCLNRCTRKHRQWLGGKSRHGFFLTIKSKQIIQQAEGFLRGYTTAKTGSKSQTRRKESILAEVISSPAYLKFLNGKQETVTVADLCYVLQGTLDTSKETLKGNLNALLKFAEELKRDDVVNFAKWLEAKFASYFAQAAT